MRDYTTLLDEKRDIQARQRELFRTDDPTQEMLDEQLVLEGRVEELDKQMAERHAYEIAELETKAARVVDTADPKVDMNKLFRTMERGVDYESRSWASNTGSGSYLVPQEWHSSVEQYRFETNWLRQTGARVIRTESTHNIPVLSALATAAITGENAAYTASDPTVSQVILYAYKMTLKTAVSEELLADAAYDVAGELARATGMAFGQAEQNYFLTGTGSSQPTGIFNKTADATSSAATALTKAELIAYVYGLARQYRDGAVWMMNDATVGEIALLTEDVTSSGTIPYWWTDAKGGEPATLLGYPIYTDGSIALTAATNKALCFGNPKFYVIGERGPMLSKRLQLSEYGDTFAFAARIDGKPLDPAAFYVVAMHA